MTASIEQERAAHIAHEAGVPLNFSMCRNGPVGAFTLAEFLKIIDSAVEHGSRRAPVVQAPLRKPTIDEVAEAVGYHDSAWDCVDPSELIDAILMLAAAPQPPEEL